MSLPASMHISGDPAIMRLAHPLRFTAAIPSLREVIRQLLGPNTFDALAAGLAEEGRLTSVIVQDLAALPEHQHLRDIVNAVNQLPAGTEMGNAFAFLLALRQLVAPAPYFRLDDQLARLLEHTDIGDDVPVGYLRAPYHRLYIEFGTARDLSLRLWNTVSGQHVLEGAYIEVGWHPQAGHSMHVMLTGSPLGKSNALDDATHSVLLPLSDEQQTLQDALRWSWGAAARMVRALHLRASPACLAEASFDCLQYLAKALLYIGLPEARQTLHRERSQFLQARDSLKSSAKRAKAERRARLLVDHILISAPPPPAEEQTAHATGRHVRAHWRRGHYRMQPYGPQRQQRRLQWIRPTLVHGELGSDAPTPSYTVR